MYICTAVQWVFYKILMVYVRTMYTYIKRDWEDALKSTVQACTYLTQALIGSIAAVLAQSGACLFVVTHRHR